MRRLEVLFALIPIRISLKMWGLSDEFINYMVYPRYAFSRLGEAVVLTS
jgi:hypothetical protein